jgi:hypothetical protein
MLVAAAKTAGVWIALLFATAAAGAAIVLPATPGGDGPLSAGEAFLAVNAISALLLAALAARIDAALPVKWLVLFAVAYVGGTLLAHIEAFFFGSFLALPPGLLPRLTAVEAIRSAAGALAAAWLWRGRAAAPAAVQGLAWKVPAISFAYVLVYFVAGFIIAWQSEAIRAFYAQGLGIDLGPLALLQVARGAVWAGLALLLVRTLRGSAGEKAVWTGIAFSIFIVAPLLYPTPVMPWPVRQVHLVEVGISNLLFGFFAAALLAARPGRRREAAVEQPA